MLKWHLKHRKQEIIGAAFTLCAALYFVIPAIADGRTEATTAQNNATTAKNDTANRRTSTNNYRNSTDADLIYVHDYYDSVYDYMTSEDRSSVAYSLSGADIEMNSCNSDYSLGESYETNPTYINPAGGDGYRTQGDMYYGGGAWTQAQNSYETAVDRYSLANGRYNMSYAHAFSSSGFISDAWDVLQHYTP